MSSGDGFGPISLRNMAQVIFMKITYDSETDLPRILFSNAPVKESNEDKNGVIIDYDREGNREWRFWMPPSAWITPGR